MEQDHIVQKIKLSFPFVNLVFGTGSLYNFPKLLYNTLVSHKRVFEIKINNKKITEGIPIKRDGFVRAWLPIMYGCDNFCSYCVVPYVRGRDILKEAQDIIDCGYKEITLLGQNVNSYGKNLEENINFSNILKNINDINGDYWIRFMTSHPKDATKELIDTIADCEHICNHLHLPFQSGNNKILNNMNRKYTREKYLELVNYAKYKIPELSISSDIIVGFPGETYKDFCDTLSLVKEVEFESLFTFIFSPRKGTSAFNMEDHIPYEEKSIWFKELLKLQEEISSNKLNKMIKKEYKVLVDGENKKGKLTSRTQGNISVEFYGDKSIIGKFARVKINKAKRFRLEANLI